MNPNNPQTQTEEQRDEELIAQLSKRQAEESNDSDSRKNLSLLEKAVDVTEQRARDQMLLEVERWKLKQRRANMFALSGCFSDIKGKTEQQAIAQALVKMELGESMGFTEVEALQGIHLIQGTPSISAALRAARMAKAGYSWEIDWFQDDKAFCIGCRLWLYKNGQPVLKPTRDQKGTPVLDDDGNPIMEHVNVAFLKANAERMKTKIWDVDLPGGKKGFRVASVLEKDNWKNTPENMYFSRAVTNLQRWYAPHVLSANLPSTEEVLDDVGGWASGDSGGYSEPDTSSNGRSAEQVRQEGIRKAAAFFQSQGKQMPDVVKKAYSDLPSEMRPDQQPEESKPEKPEEPTAKQEPGNQSLPFGRPKK